VVEDRLKIQLKTEYNFYEYLKQRLLVQVRALERTGELPVQRLQDDEALDVALATLAKIL
jgi:hypothetical protein